MEELVKSLKVSLATVFAFYLKTHYFHWNVEGEGFYQLHKMFEQIYEEVYDSVDPLAEQIRALEEYAPGSLKRFAELSKLEEHTNVPSCEEMVETLIADNDTVVQCLNEAIALATKHNKQGLVNFLGGRIEQHTKWGWFLRASKKEE